MKINSTEHKLTDGGSRILDTLVEDYRYRLIRNAEKAALQFSGDVNEISAHDVLEGSKHQDNLINLGNKLFNHPYYYFYVILITLFSVQLAITIPDFIGINNTLKENSSFILFASTILSIPVALTFYLLSTSLKRQKKDNEKQRMLAEDIAWELVRKWSIFEIKIRGLMTKYFGESYTIYPFPHIMKILKKNGTISEGDFVVLNKILLMRNAIMHKGNIPSKKELISMLTRLDKLLNETNSIKYF